MTVRDLIAQPMDIDVWDNVCEELGIAMCGPIKLTEAGKKKFREVLGYGVELHNECAVVDVDGPEGVWQKRLKKAKEFFESAAGCCAVDEYERWFVEDEG